MHRCYWLVWLWFVGILSLSGQVPDAVIVELKNPTDWGNFDKSQFSIDTIDKDWGIYQLGYSKEGNIESRRPPNGVYNGLTEYNAIEPIFRKIQKIGKVSKRVQPSDPLYPSQPYYERIGLEYVWNYNKGGVNLNGDTLVVAYIDDGVDTSHPDLKKNLWRNWKEIPGNGIDDDANGYIDDYWGWNAGEKSGDVFTSVSVLDGHGTNIAGILGSEGENDKGGAGVNWRIKILPINCYPNNLLNVESAVLRSMIYAFKNKKAYLESNGKEGINIVALNMSLGMDDAFPEDAPTWCSLYDSLGSVGIWCYSAVTNRNVDVGQAGDIPTLCPSPYLLSVNVSDNNDQHYSSGYSDTFVDVSAPGVDILTTVPVTFIPENPYSTETGTSYSAPIVAGVSTLLESMVCSEYLRIKASYPDSAMELWSEWLRSSVVKNSDLKDKSLSGGRIDASAWFAKMTHWCESNDDSYLRANKLSLNEVSVFPNPLTVGSKLNLFSNQEGRYFWMNMQGQHLSLGSVLRGTNTFEIPDLPGIYLLKVNRGGDWVTFKVVILD